jgi:hypothetical protein
MSKIQILRDLIREMALQGIYVPPRDVQAEPGDPSDWGYEKRDPSESAESRAKLAYMSSQQYQRKAEKTYKDVDLPIAIVVMPGFTGRATEYPEGESRMTPAGSERASLLRDRALTSAGVDVGSLPDDLLTLIVTSADHIPSNYKRISSPWICFHALFDDDPEAGSAAILPSYADEIFGMLDTLASCYDKRPSTSHLAKKTLTMGSARDYNISNMSDMAAEILTQAILKPGDFAIMDPPERVVGAGGTVSRLIDKDLATRTCIEIYDKASALAPVIWNLLRGQTIVLRA